MEKSCSKSWTHGLQDKTRSLARSLVLWGSRQAQSWVLRMTRTTNKDIKKLNNQQKWGWWWHRGGGGGGGRWGGGGQWRGWQLHYILLRTVGGLKIKEGTGGSREDIFDLQWSSKFFGKQYYKICNLKRVKIGRIQRKKRVKDRNSSHQSFASILPKWLCWDYVISTMCIEKKWLSVRNCPTTNKTFKRVLHTQEERVLYGTSWVHHIDNQSR